ncbi:MAG TPA: NAD-glutamate dehydrogenase [Sedimenticola sp.]|nr:NAD-glutamate dehydrogenase [Sedimenticola sp.]
MINDSEQHLRHLIEELERLPLPGLDQEQTRQIHTLLRRYYRHIPVDELLQMEPADLLGAVVAHWQLLRQRRREQPLIRVYNPDFEEHGWQSQHTIVEVVADDMAFLVDSLSMALNRAGMTIFLTIHPVIDTWRDRRGRLLSLDGPVGEAVHREESMIQFQVEKQLSGTVLDALGRQLGAVIDDVGRANRDWQVMKRQVAELRRRIGGSQVPVEAPELGETLEFLRWLEQDHFTFLAYCELDYRDDGPCLTPGSGLGLLRDAEQERAALRSIIPVFDTPCPEQRCYLTVTKANTRSTVHRPVYMDYIGIKRYNDQGRIDGEYCILGLFSSSAYSHAPREIPLLRHKVGAVMSAAGLDPRSHSGRAMLNILETFPRDALFQIQVEALLPIALGIIGLQERQRTRLFLFRDGFQRFYSCLVYVPRERYDRELRLRIQKVLMAALGGNEVEFETRLSESILARLYFVIHTTAGSAPEFDPVALEQAVIEATRTWQDGLREALLEQYGEASAGHYYREYSQAFPGGFREDFHPRTAAADIERIEQARASGELSLHFYRPILESRERAHLRLYSAGRPVPLSEVIPILENMGLTVLGERPYRIRLAPDPVWIHDFSMRYPSRGREPGTRIAALFQAAFLRIWGGGAENDGFNQLVLGAGLSWQKVMILRAYSRYLRQIRSPYSQDYVIDSLVGNPELCRLLVELFEARLDPARKQREKRIEELGARIEKRLEAVTSLDQDRIIRRFVNLIQATLRSNFHRSGRIDGDQPCLSLKLAPEQITGMPLPAPMYEIFVYSPRMEGVHLRGGRVARGGLRWSDRMDDFRTEVLGLMKAQMVKNTVIVPVGSKGGFIVKQSMQGLGREQRTAVVVACYRTLLRGMLDITDNYSQGRVVHPPDVVCHDGDDPYLVIAADKGTASFSDIANQVAAEYDFWLGDAFASGGSEGYDHKKMGITARGAWESVKRNFRELGIDIQRNDFRVVGIGDMSGDVFGNGMLLSRHIRLVGAFNHRHIFLDPEPDPVASYAERRRLFELPGSGWDDYDHSLLSAGGGVYDRTAKSIPLSEEVRSLLGLKVERLTPAELIRALLRAPVDLLWNGGIGTYVKSAAETHESVMDKANDALRVDGRELRCKVVGEGGNLGVTQLGRVEYALNGGQIYTDFIDNAAGVDCSDHEVNIKILLGQVVANGDMTRKQRNRLLVEMTDRVTERVLADNYAQSQAVSIIAHYAPERLNEHGRFMSWLEQQGRLNRELEYLPDPKQLAERQAAGKGLTKPEIALLLAYSKMTYHDALIHSEIPDDEYLLSTLREYFPSVLGERFPAEMASHPLKREIIATCLTNGIVNRIGPGFGFRMRQEVGANIAGVTRAYLAATRIFETEALWREIETLDNRVPTRIQIEMLRMVSRLLERLVNWILRYRRNNVRARAVIEYFQEGVGQLMERLPKPLAAQDRLEMNRWIRYFANAGVPRELAQRTAALLPLASALDIVEVAKQVGREVPAVAALYFRLGSDLDFHWLRRQIDGLGIQSHWHNLAGIGLVNSLDRHQRELTAQILESTGRSRSARKMITEWIETHAFLVERHQQMVSELKARSSLDFAMLSVVVTDIGSLLVNNPQ